MIFIGLSFFPVIAQATIYKDIPEQQNDNAWFVGVGAGMSWLNLNNNATYVTNGAPAPYNLDYYSVKAPSSQKQVQLDFGYRWHAMRAFAPYYSLYAEYRHYMNTNIKGSIMQYSLPDFLNYDYKMRYSADLFMLNGKIDLFEFHRLLPYISAGVGVIANHLDSYEETPLANVTPRINPGYAQRHNFDPAVSLGLGLDYKITKNIWATLGLEHLRQSSLQTSNGADSWSATHLTFGNSVKMNSVFFTITANIPDTLRS